MAYRSPGGILVPSPLPPRRLGQLTNGLGSVAWAPERLVPHGGMGSSVPGSLGWVPPAVQIAGIPQPVAAPTVSSKTWRTVRIRQDELGTEDTLDIMGQMALEAGTDPTFLEDARSVTRSCAARDYECVMAADLEFVRERVRYTEGPLGQNDEDGQVYQYLQSPGWLLYVSGQGLCADMATLEAGLLISQGIGAGLICWFLDPARPNGASHVAAFGISKDGEYVVDPVPPNSQLGDAPPPSSWVRDPIVVVIAEP